MAKRFVLKNGMRLLLKTMPQLRSVSTGIWTAAGSAREDLSLWGASHMLEHMLFKGTPSRNSLEISSVMDDVGGVLNAFTAKEQTCYYTRCLDEHFELSLALLADMYQHSLLDAEELAREKNVVIEEILMYEDSPDDLALDLFCQTLWPNHSYGRNISGTVESVSALSQAQLQGYLHSWYNSAQTVLVVVGNVSEEQAIAAAERYFTAQPDSPHAQLALPSCHSGHAYTHKDIEQTHVCMGFPGLAINDDDYYAATIVNSAFGGSASARLFQEVREKRGLAYSAFSYLENFTLGGFFLAYASSQPERTDELLRVMAGEFAKLAEKGLSADEIERGKNQLKGAMLLQLESTSNTMMKLARQELMRGRIFTPEETVERLMAVSEADINRVLGRMLQPGAMVTAQVGPTESKVPESELS